METISFIDAGLWCGEDGEVERVIVVDCSCHWKAEAMGLLSAQVAAVRHREDHFATGSPARVQWSPDYPPLEGDRHHPVISAGKGGTTYRGRPL